MHNQQDLIQVADSDPSNFIDSLLTENQDPSTDPAVDKQPQQATNLHLLPSAANSHAPVQQYKDHMENILETSSQEYKVSVHTDLQNPPRKLNYELNSVSRCTYFRYIFCTG